MIQSVANFLKSPSVWLGMASLLVIMPLLLFGSPGYYGDDVNMISGLVDGGIKGSVAHWIDEYGLSYRPLGITFIYIYYSLLHSQPTLIYFVYLLFYLLFAGVLYRQISLLTGYQGAGPFVSVFFLLFPFNPTAYWQIPSVIMIVVALFAIPVMRLLVVKSKIGDRKAIVWLSLIWLALLYSYEQIAGLVAVVVFVSWLVDIDSGLWAAIRKNMFLSALLALVTLIFMASYFLSDSNPKLIALKKINAAVAHSSVEKTMPLLEKKNTAEEIESKKAADIHSRYEAIAARLGKVTNYLGASLNYTLKKLVEAGVKGWLLLLLVSIFAAMTLGIELRMPDRSMSLAILTTGMLWLAATLAPFFLYAEVHIPPYTLMLPSVGVGLAVYGFFGLLRRWFQAKWPTFMLRPILMAAAITMPILQYGYYFGLREELSYWEDVARDIGHFKKNLLQGSVLVLHNVENKKNSHIFWLESAVGSRHLAASLGSEFSSIHVWRESDNLVMSLASHEENGTLAGRIDIGQPVQ
ncbi:MAG: hypothetical protein PVG66_11625 [Chromatiales bacterium]|jgi:hypothetical protein